MPWTDAQRKFCYYVIARVETNCDYGATNSSDAITVGIAQWYGTRAASLIERLRDEVPTSYAQLSDRIKNAISAGNTNWTRFYLERADQESWVAAANVDGNHELQDNQFYTDLEGYLDTLAYWGVNTSNVKGTIFYISMYHQSPQGCLTIVQNYGGDRDVNTLYAAAMNSPTFGLYVNRYSTVRDLLNSWDGSSEPPDFGSTDPSVPQEPGQPEDPVESSVSYIQAVGDDLIVFGANSSTSRLICHNTGRGIWIPKGGTMPDNPGTTPPSGGTHPGDPEDFAAMRAVWEQYENAFQYSNASGRLNPLASGYSDCSACIWWAANYATNNKYEWLGTRSYTMPSTCHTVVDLDPMAVQDLSDWQAGDLICMNFASAGYDGGHVDWYFGDGQLWSAGSAPLPHRINLDASTYYQYLATHGYTFRWLQRCRFL